MSPFQLQYLRALSEETRHRREYERQWKRHFLSQYQYPPHHKRHPALVDTGIAWLDNSQHAAHGMQQNWRSLIIACNFFIMIVLIMVETMHYSFIYVYFDDSHFSFLNFPDGQTRSTALAMGAVSILQFSAYLVNAFYFFVLWGRVDHTYLKSCISLGLLLLTLVLGAVGLWLTKESARTLSLNALLSRRSDRSAEDRIKNYSEWIQKIKEQIVVAFSMSVVCGIIQTGTIALCLWLLPARQRLPNRYGPQIESKKGNWMGNIDQEPQINLDQIGLVATGPLETVFREHEKMRGKDRNIKATKSTNDSRTTASKGFAKRSTQRLPPGPQFDPAHRYWILRNSQGSSNRKKHVLTSFKRWLLAFFIVNVSFGIAFLAMITQRNVVCYGYCYAIVASQWLFSLWDVAFSALLWLQIAPDRKILYALRLDVLLCSSFYVFCVFWLISNITGSILITIHYVAHSHSHLATDDPILGLTVFYLIVGIIILIPLLYRITRSLLSFCFKNFS